jgi:hypothetical protein
MSGEGKVRLTLGFFGLRDDEVVVAVVEVVADADGDEATEEGSDDDAGEADLLEDDGDGAGDGDDLDDAADFEADVDDDDGDVVVDLEGESFTLVVDVADFEALPAADFAEAPFTPPPTGVGMTFGFALAIDEAVNPNVEDDLVPTLNEGVGVEAKDEDELKVEFKTEEEHPISSKLDADPPPCFRPPSAFEIAFDSKFVKISVETPTPPPPAPLFSLSSLLSFKFPFNTFTSTISALALAIAICSAVNGLISGSKYDFITPDEEDVFDSDDAMLVAVDADLDEESGVARAVGDSDFEFASFPLARVRTRF